MTVVRWIIVLVLILHGIGHVMGFLAAFTTTPVGWRDASWLLGGDFCITSAVGKAWGLLWLVALIGFVGAGLGLIGGRRGGSPWRRLRRRFRWSRSCPGGFACH